MNTTPEEVIDLAHRLVEQYLPGWRFDLDNAKRRAGACFHRRRIITLSKWYIAMNLDKFDDLRDTILHEIAHGLAGSKAHHGPEWKKVCVKIGARPERCYDSSIIAMPPDKYEAICPTCSRKFYRAKRVPWNKYKYCLKCGPTDGRLKYVRVDAVQTTDLPPLPTTIICPMPKVKPLKPSRS